MATKADERKALEEIRRIVASLGNDSYLAMAFDGCFEMAESNIENDFANNPKKSIENLQRDLRVANAKIKNAEEAYEIVLKREQSEKKSWDAEEKKYKDRLSGLIKEKFKILDEATELKKDYDAFGEKLETLELENMKLKARLYDLMVKED